MQSRPSLIAVPALRWLVFVTLASAPFACDTKPFTNADADAGSGGKATAGDAGNKGSGAKAGHGGSSTGDTGGTSENAGAPAAGGSAGTTTSSGGRGGRRAEGGRSGTIAGRGGRGGTAGDSTTGGEAGMSAGAAGEGDASGTGGTAGSGTGGTAGAAGGFAGGGTGGAPSVGHRYARFVALTSIPNDNLTSVAEFEILDALGQSLPRSGWTPTVDSQELADSYSPGSQAIDGDVNTVWQTEWGDYVAPLPHMLTIDMGQAELVSGFVYTPRQDWYSGRIGSWEFYLSNDPSDFGTAVASGDFPDSMAVSTKTFPTQ